MKINITAAVFILSLLVGNQVMLARDLRGYLLGQSIGAKHYEFTFRTAAEIHSKWNRVDPLPLSPGEAASLVQKYFDEKVSLHLPAGEWEIDAISLVKIGHEDDWFYEILYCLMPSPRQTSGILCFRIPIPLDGQYPELTIRQIEKGRLPTPLK